MQTSKKQRLTVALVGFCMGSGGGVAFAQATATFQWLGDLGGSNGCPAVYSDAMNVSADGSVVVGVSCSNNGLEAFSWTSTGGFTALGDLPTGGFHSEALGASNSGNVIVGYGTIDDMGTDRTNGFQWMNNVMLGIGDLPLGTNDSRVYSASADGSLLVGRGYAFNGEVAFTWDNNRTPRFQTLDGFQPFPYNFARDVSDDASVVVGYGIHLLTELSEAARWVAPSTTIQGLGDLPGGIAQSEAYGISADGRIIVGWGTSGIGKEAFLWQETDAGGTVCLRGLDDLTGVTSTEAIHVSANGAVVVGAGKATGNVDEAFVWDPALGMRTLKDMLTMEHGVTLSASTNLEYARGVSDDGKVIVGRGLHTDTNVTEAWMVTFDACSPSDCDDGTACTFDICAAGCSNGPSAYADVAGAGKCCGPDGVITDDDVNAVLDGFAGVFTLPCSAHNMDIEPCSGNNTINVFDIFAAQNAKNGIDPCNCSGGMMASSGGGSFATLSPGGSAPPASISIRLAARSAAVSASGAVDVDVFASGLTDLRGYELQLVASGGGRGTLDVTALSIDQFRTDFVFNGLDNLHAIDVLTHRAVCTLSSGSVSSTEERYLGTITFTASASASGQFTVSTLLSDGSDGILAGDTNGAPMTVNVTSDALITVN